MNKTLVITTIALVAVVMGFSAVAPVIPLAYAEHPCGEIGRAGHTCIPQEKPSCNDIADEMNARGASAIAIEKFLENCVDRP